MLKVTPNLIRVYIAPGTQGKVETTAVTACEEWSTAAAEVSFAAIRSIDQWLAGWLAGHYF